MHDGTQAIALTPGQLLRRLASIVPPPEVHSTRSFGAFAPAAKVRACLVNRGGGRGKGCLGEPPAAPEGLDDGGAEDARLAWELGQLVPPDDFEGPPLPERPRFLGWPQLLARAFAVDVLRGDKCGGRRKLSAFIVASREACEILEMLGIDATAPPTAPPRRTHRQVQRLDPPPDEPGIDPPSPD